ncbi:DoxX family protein [Streptomyces sp. MJP52]|uniref:DoxX family protein n=1 Tax=Streptomyces sp. MJP52 TaxID=2940555 RepID=UPI00247403E8|nr:DoxX family protein [Streptomyces sp. MJP52]MDH6225456.1 thiosulfate dehydrogenase [quinone] large subunit [Streptomyces sp. MJP52]
MAVTTTGTTRASGPREAAARFALLPLRLFLGATFLYAGLHKLTDSAFLEESGPGSIGGQMEAVRDASAVPALVDLGLGAPVAFGLAIALGELAVGLGALLGLFTRVAAAGGALVSLSLWLTMSWTAEPYYLGNDLPYLMAWTPLLLAGGGALSLDGAWRARRDRRAKEAGADTA